MSTDVVQEIIDQFVAARNEVGEQGEMDLVNRTEAEMFVDWFRQTYPATPFPSGLTGIHLRAFLVDLREIIVQVPNVKPEAVDLIHKLKICVVGTFASWLASEAYVLGDPSAGIAELEPLLTEEWPPRQTTN